MVEFEKLGEFYDKLKAYQARRSLLMTGLPGIKYKIARECCDLVRNKFTNSTSADYVFDDDAFVCEILKFYYANQIAVSRYRERILFFKPCNGVLGDIFVFFVDGLDVAEKTKNDAFASARDYLKNMHITVTEMSTNCIKNQVRF